MCVFYFRSPSKLSCFYQTFFVFQTLKTVKIFCQLIFFFPLWWHPFYFSSSHPSDLIDFFSSLGHHSLWHMLNREPAFTDVSMLNHCALIFDLNTGAHDQTRAHRESKMRGLSCPSFELYSVSSPVACGVVWHSSNESQERISLVLLICCDYLTLYYP